MLHPILDRAASRHPSAATARAAAAADLAPRLARTADLAAHTGCVNTVAFIDGGDRLVTGSDDMTVAVWRVGGAGGAAVEWRARTAHRANVFQARFLSESSLLATCAADGEVHLYSFGPAGPPRGPSPPPHRRLFAHGGRAHKMALSPDTPTTLYTVGEDGQFAVLDARAPPGAPAGGLAFAGGRGGGGRIPIALFAVAVDPTRPHLVAVGGEACLGRVIDTRSLPAPGAVASRPPTAGAFMPEHLTRAGRRTAALAVTGLAYDAAGRLLASYNGDAAYLFPPGAPANVPSRVFTREVPPGSDSEDDGDDGAGGSGRPFDARAPGDDARPDHEGVRRFSGAVNVRTVKGAVFLDPHGDHVACGSDDGRFLVWCGRTSRLRAAREADDDVVNIIAPHPTAPMTLATSGIDDTVKLWAPVGDRVPVPADLAEVAAAAMRGRDMFGWAPDTSGSDGSDGSGSGGEDGGEEGESG